MERFDSFVVPSGSRIHNKHDKNSDHDVKTFYLPSFDDLYNSVNASSQVVGKGTDHEYHDVRKVPYLMFEANPNYISILFPDGVIHNDDLYEKLTASRDDIARMNIAYLYDSSLGMFNRQRKDFERDSAYVPLSYFQDPKPWQQQVGKHVAGAYHALDLILRFYHNGFTDFGSAMWYKDEETARLLILEMRKGEMGYLELKDILAKKEAEYVALKSEFKSHTVNEELRHELELIVKRHVQHHVARKLI